MMIRRTGWIVLPTALSLLLAANSFAAPQDAAEEAQPAAKPKSDVLLEDNPLLTEPRTPQTLMDAVVLMIDLARPGLARLYLEKLMEANPDDAMLLKLLRHRDGLPGAQQRPHPAVHPDLPPAPACIGAREPVDGEREPRGDLGDRPLIHGVSGARGT